MTLLLPLSFFLVPSWLYNDQASANPLDKIRAFLQKLRRGTSQAAVSSKFEKSADLERIITYLNNQALHFEQELKHTEQRHGILRSEYAIHRKSCLASARAIAIGEHLK
jgi:hypothetical protein